VPKQVSLYEKAQPPKFTSGALPWALRTREICAVWSGRSVTPLSGCWMWIAAWSSAIYQILGCCWAAISPRHPSALRPAGAGDPAPRVHANVVV